MTMDDMELMNARLLEAKFAFEIVMAMVDEGLPDDVSRDFALALARKLASLASGVTQEALKFAEMPVDETMDLF